MGNDTGGEFVTSGNVSHTRAVPSQEPVTTRRPSGLNAAAVTGPACPARAVSRFRSQAWRRAAVVSVDTGLSPPKAGVGRASKASNMAVG